MYISFPLGMGAVALKPETERNVSIYVTLAVGSSENHAAIFCCVIISLLLC
jgi:hypothetical protein